VFDPGATVVRRDVVGGKVLTAAPFRVLDDDGEVLRLACWPGIESLAPATWIRWLQTGDDAVRKQGIPDFAAGRWRLAPWVWRATTLVSWFGVDPDFSVHLFTPVDGGAPWWYVNFERPPRRTGIGIDTCDLLLDLAADADLRRWSWKDEDEYAEGRRLGLITDEDHERVRQARHRAVALLESRGGPFAEKWEVSADWPTPVLPPHSTRV
jgi:hypothetical protein